MSVATQRSPFAVGCKRLYENEENEDHIQRQDSGAGSHKRHRQRGSPVGRCGSDSAQHAYTVSHATFAAVRGLFLEMSDKVIADVLAEYGDNIDAAIRHLSDLRLSTASSSAPAPEQGKVASEQQLHHNQEATADASAGPASTCDGDGVRPAVKSADDWVDTVVAEMAAAKDMTDARARASRLLQAFEQAAVYHAKQSMGLEFEQLRGQLQEAQRENQLLKRAVTIQNARMQELSGKEAEVAQLRQMLEGYQQKLHALEVQNYSLALHLKQATDGKNAMSASSFKNPDIF